MHKQLNREPEQLTNVVMDEINLKLRYKLNNKKVKYDPKIISNILYEKNTEANAAN